MPRESLMPNIVSELKRSKSVGRTIEQIAEKLDCSPLTVRKHLTTLIARGDVAWDTLETGRRGRPPHIYFMSGARPS